MSTSDSNPMLEGALELLRRRVKVVALRPGSKEPLTRHGVKDATSDEAAVRGIWRRCPNANLAIACGASGIVILDFDMRNGAERSLPLLRQALGDLSRCALARTPGGFHVPFREPRDPELKKLLGNGCAGLLPGIDVLAGERYGVAPPSKRSDGTYEWVRDFDSIDDLPEFPATLVHLVSERGGGVGTKQHAAFALTTIPVGLRNHAAFETACTLFRQGLSAETAIEELRGMRERGRFENPVDNPFTDDEIRECVASALKAVSKNASKHEWRDVRSWPTLDPGALYGLAGELVHAIEYETEADPAALLTTLLVGFGNAIGASAHARVQDDLHPARLFVAIVGSTSTGGKGTSLATIRPFLRAADSSWLTECRKSGFGSGESLITELSGAHRSKDDKSPIEHRAFVTEPEFARLLTINARDGSTLSPILRAAWDDGRLELRHSKASMVAIDAHVSLLAHITPEELRAKLSSIEVASGFANRVLFVLSQRKRKLPSGGNITSELVAKFGDHLNKAIQFARRVGRMERSPEAEKLWEQLYHAEPDREGLVGAICDRWQAQKLRLSVVYALLDRSAVICPEHLIAAEAFWRYCVASTERIWGAATGYGDADRLLQALREVYPAGISRDEARGLFARHISSDRLTAAIDDLCRRGLARVEKQPTEGRSREILYAVTCA